MVEAMTPPTIQMRMETPVLRVRERMFAGWMKMPEPMARLRTKKTMPNRPRCSLAVGRKFTR